MSTFTVFNHGTDFHRDKNPHEVITLLSEAVEGTEARIVQEDEPTDDNPLPFGLETQNPTFLICEGPGSDELTADASAKGVAHAHPGKYNPIFGTSKSLTPKQLNPKLKDKARRWLGLRKGDDSFRKDFMGNTSSSSRTAGRILGHGWEDNVYKVVWLLTHLKMELGMSIDTVNLAGWSRGAVTCLKMANKIYDVFEDSLALNIFAIDPVPGGLTSEADDMKIIPPNVRNYLAILALDDTRSNFLALDREHVNVQVPKTGHRLPAPQVHFLPLPGNHSDVVITKKDGGFATDSAKMCLHLGHRFLKSHGTRFRAGTVHEPTPAQVVEKYLALQRDAKTIASKAQSSLLSVVGGRRVDRAVREKRNRYVIDPHIFVNEHHRQCLLVPHVTASEASLQAHPSGDAKTYAPGQAYLFQMGISYPKP